jgi:hypothetical protein
MNVNFSQSNEIPLGGLHTNYDFINQYGSNPYMIAILLVIILLYYFVIRNTMSSETTPSAGTGSLNYLEVFLWALFIIILVLNGVRYFYDLDITTSIKNIFSREPEVDINVDNIVVEPEISQIVPEITYEKQVFHIPNNKYTYKDAQAVCKAYGARLASYNEVEDSYNEGGEWCGYGWSDDQLALYPTQKKTYDELQKIKGHEHDCGRPGINGGFIANPKVKFGVNCYGYKPEITPYEKETMELSEIYKKTNTDLKFDEKVDEFKEKLPQIQVAPFNNKVWSKI